MYSYSLYFWGKKMWINIYILIRTKNKIKGGNCLRIAALRHMTTWPAMHVILTWSAMHVILIRHDRPHDTLDSPHSALESLSDCKFSPRKNSNHKILISAYMSLMQICSYNIINILHSYNAYLFIWTYIQTQSVQYNNK